MAKGNARTIAKIVAEKNPGPVLVYENGQLVSRQIIGWHTTPRNGRRFLRIGLESLAGREAAIVTEDHLILTRNGWKEACKLTSDDEVATAYPTLSAIQKQLLIGGLLGDTGLSGHGTGRNRSSINESHTTRDRAYVEAKVSAFAGLGITIQDREPDKTHPNGMVQYWSKSLPSLAEYGEAFYPNGKKIVPRELIESDGLSDAALAIWYMDDGSTTIHNGVDSLHPYCHVATNGFPDDDVYWLVGYLTDHGFPCTALESKGSTGTRINFTKDGSQALVEHIARFVPPSLRYKVGHLNGLDNFDPSSWGTGQSVASWGRVIVTEFTGPLRKSSRKIRDDSVTYCLSVEGESQNFVAGPIVVHNCSQDIVSVGFRYHMTDDQAAVGLANLDLAQQNVARARAHAQFYYEQLHDVPGLVVPPFDPSCDYWLHGMIVEEDRDGFMARMAERGIPTSRAHARNDHHTGFAVATARQDGDLPGTTYFDDHQVNVPGGGWLSMAECERVFEAIKQSVPAPVTA